VSLKPQASSLKPQASSLKREPQAQASGLKPQTEASSRSLKRGFGAYALAIRPGSYLATVNGVFAGLFHVTTGRSRGDFLARQGTCVSRYGVVADAQSRQPIAGVRVELSGQTTTTDQDGWYRVDFGCPANGLFGFNTTIIFFSRPGYDRACAPAGRGVFGAERFDFFLGGHHAPGVRPVEAASRNDHVG